MQTARIQLSGLKYSDITKQFLLMHDIRWLRRRDLYCSAMEVLKLKRQ